LVFRVSFQLRLIYSEFARFAAHILANCTYIERSGGFIPNYGERYRNGERISTGFVESAVNQVVSKRQEAAGCDRKRSCVSGSNDSVAIRYASGVSKIGDSPAQEPAAQTNRLEGNLLPLEESLDDGPRTPEDKRPTLDDRRTTEAVIDGLLLAHSAELEPEGDGWLLRYRLASAHLQEQQLDSFEATLPIVGETRKDALLIAELVLRGHEPPEIPTQPATEPPPHAKFAMRRSIDPTCGQDRRRPADMSAYQLAEAPAV
jgi:hypothetical protein